MTTIKGNLISLAEEDSFDLIAHGANTKKKEWGAGIVVPIKEAFPWAHKSYVDCLEKNNAIPGTVDFAKDPESDFVVANWFAQIYPGRCYEGRDGYEQRLEFIQKCAKITNKKYAGCHIGIPKIGCGIAGLNWVDVEPILRAELNNMKVTVVIL